MNLTINEELRELIPAIQEEERNLLEQSLLNEGCRDALIVWGNTIVDGHNRYEICTRHDIPFEVTQMEFDSIGQAKRWMIENQLARRNLTDSQRRYFIGKRYEEEKKPQGGTGANEHTKEQSGNSCHSAKTAEDIAKKNNISERTVRNNADYSRAIDEIKKTDKEVAEKILAEEIKLANTDVLEIAREEDKKRKHILRGISKGKPYKKVRKEEREKERAKNLVTRELPKSIYQVIYCDPPWQYSNTGFAMSAENQYPTVPTKEIAEMPIEELADENAVMFMWATNPLLEDALQVMKSWGFEYKTNIVWTKKRHTAGFYVFGQHELLLIGVKGSMLPIGSKPTSILTGENNVHSKKPEEAYRLIESMYPNLKYVELFARNTRENWESWGNEV